MQPKYLIWGEHGWIAGYLIDLLHRQSKDVHATSVHMQDQAAMNRVLNEVKPTHVINCAGKTGVPNVDWCEDHKIETIESNVIGTLMLAQACSDSGIHLTVMATGCIYTSTYNPSFDTLTGRPYTEEDTANFGGSFYSYTKSRVEDLLRHYPNTLVLRIRMPVSDDLHRRSFVTKITKYHNVVNIPNSHSILYDLLPVVIAFAENRETGVVNFTNPGAISHNEVLSLYRDIVDPTFTWQNFTLEEQSHVVKAERSNCELDATKLMHMVEKYRGKGYEIEVPEIHEAYRKCFERMKVGMQQKPGAQVTV